MRDIEIYSDMYKMLGIDEVYFLTKPGLSFATLINRDAKLPCLADTDLEFLHYLNQKVNNNDRTDAFLSAYWSFQALINDGEVEQITQQPLERALATMLKETKNVQAIKQLGIKDDTLIWTPTFLARTLKFARDIYYYRLHPNIELKKHLFKKR